MPPNTPIWHVDLLADNTVRLLGQASRMTFRSTPPDITGRAQVPELDFLPMSSSQATVAGSKGALYTQRAVGEDYEVQREVHLSDDGRTLAVRLTFSNTGTADLRLGSLAPVLVQDAKGLRIAETGVEGWRVVRMSRQKNDVPSCFRPTQRDGDWQQARIDGAEFRAGMGDTAAQNIASGRDPDSVPSDPGICIHAEAGAPALMIAVLGQTRHLNRIVLATTPERDALRELRVTCEFDDTLIVPGASCRTHWVVLREDAEVQDLWNWHADRLAERWGVPMPSPAPTVFCSWYFYGRDFVEADVYENLAELQRRPTPLDSFLLDNGWMDNFGDWNAHPERFPSGMPAIASAIQAAGFRPGIWTCPFVISPRSSLIARHPLFVLRDAEGKPCTFPYREPEFSEDLYVLDPTAPGAADYLEALYRTLSDWGFSTHKLDFLRAVIVPVRPRFHDATATRAQAYRRGLEAIRRGAGNGYILACGGLFEGSAGLVDGNRIGSDVKGRWHEPDGKPGHLVRIKQNLFRNYTNRLWHTDPDALQLRRRKGSFRGQGGYAHLSDGSFTDDEAFTCVVNQYLGGGLVCFSERMLDFDEDRRRMLRHVVPPSAPPARPLDLERPGCPTQFLTRVTPRAPELTAWWTLTICNWEDAAVEREVDLSATGATGPLAVFEFATQEWLGVHDAEGKVTITLPPHGSRVLRIASWDGRSPLLLGTDCHLTGGAAEFASFVFENGRITGRLDTPWNLPVIVSVGLPAEDGLRLVRFTIDEPGEFIIPVLA